MTGDNEIIKLNLNNGSIEGQITVNLQNDYPIGNLFSNGKNIYIMSLRQIHSVVDVTKKGDLNINRKVSQGQEGETK